MNTWTLSTFTNSGSDYRQGVSGAGEVNCDPEEGVDPDNSATEAPDSGIQSKKHKNCLVRIVTGKYPLCP